MNALYIPDNHLRLVEEPDGSITISLSEHLSARIGDPDWVNWSAVPGDELSPGIPFASIETNKAVYEATIPFPAVLAENNPLVQEKASLLCSQPKGDGWLCRIRPSVDAWRDGLLDEAAYSAYIAP